MSSKPDFSLIIQKEDAVGNTSWKRIAGFLGGQYIIQGSRATDKFMETQIRQAPRWDAGALSSRRNHRSLSGVPYRRTFSLSRRRTTQFPQLSPPFRGVRVARHRHLDARKGGARAPRSDAAGWSLLPPRQNPF